MPDAKTELEQLLTNFYKLDMIAYMAVDPEAFVEALEMALDDKQPYSWRAAWLLWSCMDENDKRIQAYTRTIINSLPNRSDEQQREFFIILQKMDLDEEDEGLLYDHCISVWIKVNKKPSVRFNAFKMLLKIAENHPDLMHEIELIVQDQYMETLSSAVKKSVFKMMNKALEQNHPL